MEDKSEFTFMNFIHSIQYEVASFAAFGGALGLAKGFYMGDLAALYGYTYSFGCGIYGVSFFGGNYALKHFRKKDDIYNPVISGSASAIVLSIA